MKFLLGMYFWSWEFFEHVFLVMGFLLAREFFVNMGFFVGHVVMGHGIFFVFFVFLVGHEIFFFFFFEHGTFVAMEFFDILMMG